MSPSSSSHSALQRTAHEAEQLRALIDVGLLKDKHVNPPLPKKTKQRQRAAGPQEIEPIHQRTSSHSLDAGPPRVLRSYYVPKASDPDDHQGLRCESRASLARVDHNTAMATKSRETRRERTFVGSSCAACEELLEHTLRGERVLQLSCGHIAHEACFYEYIKEFQEQTCPTCQQPLGVDPSRGGGIDFEKLNRLVRSAQPPSLERDPYRETQSTPALGAWSNELGNQPIRTSASRQQQQQRTTRDNLLPPQVRKNELQYEPYQAPAHGRNISADTGAVSAGDIADAHGADGRRHDYDVQSMETSLSAPRVSAKNPIPAPTVTVRSEFPTISKSRQQQSLTCLVTVEVPDHNWQADPDDLRNAPSQIQHEQEYAVEPKSARTKESHRPMDSVHDLTESREALASAKEELIARVDNWHGLDYSRFGKLIICGTMRVGKDRQSWQELECYLFTEMLICVKEKKPSANADRMSKGKCTLKGSILIKKHLKHVEHVPEQSTLSLSLSVAELPHFHLQSNDRAQLDRWRRTLVNFDRLEVQDTPAADSEQDNSGTEDDDNTRSTSRAAKRSSVYSSSYGANRSQATAPTEYTNSRLGLQDPQIGDTSLHVPLDLVVVIPVSSSMQGLKINLLRDTLRFLVSNLGERDRMGLVTFGSGAGGVPLVGMTSKKWRGWSKVVDSIRPVGQKSMRADVVEGANVAMDLLMQRKASNPLSSILLVSDSATSDAESVNFVVSRAEAAKITIHSFGLGTNHKPDTMVELSARTKASYTYVKDWMMLRECVAGCLGSLQSTSHQNVKLKLRLPEGSPAKFVKVSGALQITKRAAGRDVEAALGDLRFGDKRDILVQLIIAPDNSSPDAMSTDPWENIISGLEALGGPIEQDDQRTMSVEELPLIQADLVWGDLLRDGNLAQLPRPSLLAITMLPTSSKGVRQPSPPIPPHPHVVQRRMELLTSDMLSRALTLVSRGQHDRAQRLLSETRSIIKGLGKGGLPPLPPPSAALPPTPKIGEARGSPTDSNAPSTVLSATIPLPLNCRRTPSPPRPRDISPFTPAAGIDHETMAALDHELESSLEWIPHPAIFGRDARKAVLQSIGVISTQRGLTFRTEMEGLWAGRIRGVKRMAEGSRMWREGGREVLEEEV